MVARWPYILLGLGGAAGGLAWALSAGAGAAASPLAEPEVAALTIRVRNRKRLNGVLDSRLMAFLDWWDAHGPFMVTVGVDGGIRADEAKQAALYAQGRTAPGNIVTNAATLALSAHGRRGGLDLWVYKPETVTDGTFVPDFDTDNPATLARYRAMGEAGKRLGLTWGGDFKMRDFPHFEVPDWKSLPYPPPLGVS